MGVKMPKLKEVFQIYKITRGYSIKATAVVDL